MRSTIAVVTAVLVLGLAAGCGDTASASGGAPKSDAPSTKAPASTRTPSASPSRNAPAVRIEVSGGKVTKGPREVTAKLGDHVVLEVVTDKADELHVHGYDVEAHVHPGEPARVSFDATIPGVFEVELHSGVALCELRVS